MQQLRSEAYGKDIGQHSWVSAEELELRISSLALSRLSRLFDLGCGPCGTLAFIAGLIGCRVTGVDLSANAITAGRARVTSLRLQDSIELHQMDLNDPLPFESGSFDAVISVDTNPGTCEIAHKLFARQRGFCHHGPVPFYRCCGDHRIHLGRGGAAEGSTRIYPICRTRLQRTALGKSGFRLLERSDQTESLLQNATGRLTARLAHEAELMRIEGNEIFERQLRYLEM